MKSLGNLNRPYSQPPKQYSDSSEFYFLAGSQQRKERRKRKKFSSVVVRATQHVVTVGFNVAVRFNYYLGYNFDLYIIKKKKKRVKVMIYKWTL